MLLSVLIHMLLLSLTLGNRGLWLPRFSFPWQVGRIEVFDLQVALVPAPITAVEQADAPVAESLQQAGVDQPLADGPAPRAAVSGAPTSGSFAASMKPESSPRTDANPRPDAKPRTDANPMPHAKPRTVAQPRTDGKPRTGTKPGKATTTDIARAEAHLGADQPGDAAPPPPAPDMTALARTDESTWVIPATPPTPPPVIAEAPSASNPQTVMPSLRDADDAARARIDQEASEAAAEPAKIDPPNQEPQRQADQIEAAREDAAHEEAAQAENARLETERQEAARREAERQEAKRQEAKRVEAAQVDNARVEAARAEAARIEAARAESARAEAARIEAARIEAARVEAAQADSARVEAAREEAARNDAARIDATRIDAARVEAEQQAIERKEAARRAMGRQLDAEAARREAAARQSPSWSPARRYRLFGRTDPNEEIILYAEAWARKIHLNMTFDMVRDAVKEPHTDPLVTVAIRSDGSVESVTFVQSSGVAAIDEAIRRIVDSQTPYQVFSPALAREYDVIEIRRTWHFDAAIRLY
ncbi:MAG TPA: TonB C-terminal domain-containing protein [Casimicrobiaceae bacterium]